MFRIVVRQKDFIVTQAIFDFDFLRLRESTRQKQPGNHREATDQDVFAFFHSHDPLPLRRAKWRRLISMPPRSEPIGGISLNSCRLDAIYLTE
jgi:hypothetical protein